MARAQSPTAERQEITQYADLLRAKQLFESFGAMFLWCLSRAWRCTCAGWKAELNPPGSTVAPRFHERGRCHDVAAARRRCRIYLGLFVHGQQVFHWIGLAGLPVVALLGFRSLALVGAPVLPFPPLYPAWFEALSIGTAVPALSFSPDGLQRARSR